MRLAGKVALVTGGARGIGQAIAVAFQREGAVVVVADLAEGAEQVMDVAEPGSVSAGVAAILARHGRIDVLVNNAGVGGNTPFLETGFDEWTRVIGTNLTGAFLVAQACARAMAAGGGGRIVNISSVSAQRGGEGRAAYGSAKAGLELLTKVMAVELAALGIGVNAIAPGAVETEMAKALHDQAARDAYGRLIPMVRYGTPEEIADAAVFLCSDEARYITGQVLNVDGGFGSAGLMARRDPG